jgi:hypothetical protein
MKTTLLSLISLTALLHTAFAGVNTANVDVWVRHAADIDRKGRHIWYGDNLYDNNTVRQPQERWITVPLNSGSPLATQSFFFNIQVDAAHSNFLWLRTINGHDFHTTARPGFKYDPARWDVVLSFQRSDGTWAKVTDYIINWRKHYPHGDGFPLGPVGPTAKTLPNVLFRMDITPKVMPKSGTGITLGLYSLTMFAHSDFASATVTYK